MMSRRKQQRPKPVKDEVCTPDTDSERSSKRSRLSPAPVKSEPCSASSRLDCQLCDQWFDSIGALQTHTLKTHVPQFDAQLVRRRRPQFQEPSSPPKDSLRCPVCSQRFEDLASRHAHLVSHFESVVSLRACADCGTVVPSGHAHQQHCLDRHLTVQHLCTICAHISDSAKEFRDHCILHSVESVSFECNACRVAFDSRELLGIHVQLMHDREGLVFDVHPMEAALIQRNGDGEREIRVLNCSVCDERCLGEDALDEHRLFSHCKVTRADNCAECQEKMTSSEDFERHTRMHARDMYMHCAVCRQSLRSESQLLLHSRFHMQSPQKSPSQDSEQQCHVCGKTLVCSSQLSLHLLEHDPHRECPFCRLRFSLAQNLLAHVQDRHSHESPCHSCDVCGEQFMFKIQHEHHKLSHGHDSISVESNGDANAACFSCSQCNQIFSSVSSLQAHSSVHRDGIVRRCPICALSFNTHSRYENHVRKHANTSSCICQICGDGFTRRQELESHMKVHKGNLELGSKNLIF